MDSNDDDDDLRVKQRRQFDYFSSNAQGAQGSQMKIESNATKKSEAAAVSINDMGMPSGASDFDPNSTQTNALLNIKDNQFNLILQQLYYSEKCSWFYIGLLVLSFGLILVTIFDGFQVADSPMFIVLEFILNLLIGIDFGLRIKLSVENFRFQTCWMFKVRHR